MCGIAGAIGDFVPSETEGLVGSMVSALAHRGPDDRGCRSWNFAGNTVALGHTRLSILDLSSAGHQPMTEPTGHLWIVFNGEIYNFRELRRLLDPARSIFRTDSDTEAILHAYRRWSADAFGLFKGMFAFALLDAERQVVHLVRDQGGIKPLYYYIAGERLLFASEVAALLATGLVPHRITPNAVSGFLGQGWVGNTIAAISGIQVLRPGQMLTVDLGSGGLQWKISAYRTSAPLPSCPSSHDRDESVAHILHLLEQSVKRHLISDVSLGLFLSGGIDSTALLDLITRVSNDIPRTFTVVFPEKDFSERGFAALVAEKYQSFHTELELSESDLLSQLPAALEAMDQPTMDGINTFVIARAVRQAGMKVALSGVGSDELFAGYPSFSRARLATVAARVPAVCRVGISAAVRKFGPKETKDKLSDLLSGDCTPLSAYRISRRLFAPHGIKALLGRHLPSFEPEAYESSGDVINDVSRLEMTDYMTGLLLRDTDFMSMASSLEVRVPFVDQELIRHTLSLPGKWKVHRSKPKSLLLEAMRGAIPNYVWNRRKMGFVFPLDRWMRSALHDQVHETLNNARLAEAAGLVPAAVSDIWRSFLKGESRWSKPWSLFVLLRWCERQRASV